MMMSYKHGGLINLTFL